MSDIPWKFGRPLTTVEQRLGWTPLTGHQEMLIDIAVMLLDIQDRLAALEKKSLLDPDDE